MEDEFAMPMDNHEFHRLINHQRQDVGNFSEMLVAASFFRRGGMVSKPLGVSKGYDLIVDDGDRLVRVQVKTISTSKQIPIGWKKQTIEWETGLRKWEHVPKYTLSSFDLMAAVDRFTYEVFVIPNEDIDFSKSSFPMNKENREKYLFVALVSPK